MVLGNITVCDGCRIGAGAIVLNDLTEPGTYVGQPAHKIVKHSHITKNDK